MGVGLVLLAGTIAFGGLMTRLARDRDPWASLPNANLETTFFRQTLERFGLDRTLAVGVRFPGGVMRAEGLAELADLTEAIAAGPGVNHVLSFSTASDLRPSFDGFEAVDLLDPIPRDDEAARELGRYLASHPLLAGRLVSEDGAAARIVARLGATADWSSAENQWLQGLVANHPHQIEGQAWQLGELNRLSRVEGGRWGAIMGVGLVIALVIGFWRRDRTAALAPMFLVIWWGVGGRGISDRTIIDLELVLPLVLLVLAVLTAAARPAAAQPAGASGSIRALAGATLLVATVFFSGIPSGILNSKARIAYGCAALPLLLWALRRRPGAPRSRVRPWALSGLLLLLLPVGPSQLKTGLPSVESPVFREDFGVEENLMVVVHGDVREPLVMQRLAELEDELQSIDGVGRVTGLAGIVRHLGGMLGDGRRIPMDRGKLGNLYFFVEGTPDVASLVVPENDVALVHLEVEAGADPVSVAEACRRRVAEISARPSSWVEAVEGSGELAAWRRDQAALDIAGMIEGDPETVRSVLGEASPLDLDEGEVDSLVVAIEDMGLESDVAAAFVARTLAGRAGEPSGSPTRSWRARSGSSWSSSWRSMLDANEPDDERNGWFPRTVSGGG